MPELEPLAQRICERFPEAEVRVEEWLRIRIPAAQLHSLMRFLKEDPEIRAEYLRNLTAVDWKDHFEVVYHLTNLETLLPLEVSCVVPRDAPVLPSVTDLWRAADWQEREVYDLFGIEFQGHPNLTRILLPEDWEGFPLRKDYPIQGPLKEEPIRWEHLFKKHREEEKRRLQREKARKAEGKS